jgi:hypothetical protein
MQDFQCWKTMAFLGGLSKLSLRGYGGVPAPCCF